MARPGFRSRAAAQRFASAYDRARAAWPEATERLEVVTDLGVTATYVLGSGDGPTVVLLPGAGATAMAWLANVADLARTHRVIAPDVPGQAGRSTVVPERATGAEAVLEWLDQLVERLGAEGCTLVGHGYGAWLSLYYALGIRPRCGAVALVDPTSCFIDPHPWYRVRGAPALVLPSPGALASLVTWETRGRALEPLSHAVHVTGAAYQGIGTEVPRRPNRQALEALTLPVLVVAAGRSRQHRAQALVTEAETTGRNVTTVTIPGASHFSLPATDAGALAGALRAFLAGDEGGISRRSAGGPGSA